MHVDYHNHTVLCHHAYGDIEEYLEEASRLGIEEFGFAEHSFWMVRPGERQLAPTREETVIYLGWMNDAKGVYDGNNGRPLLRVGLEADWVPERLAEAKEFIESYPFDYIIGSVHHLQLPRTGQWISSWGFSERDVDEVYRLYFDSIADMARSGLCDIIGHLDVIRRCSYQPTEDITTYAERIVPALVESGVAVEINASGRDHPNGDFFPARPILARLVEAGVPITFGSDSHDPSHVGRYMNDVREFLKECGGTEFVRFEKRRMIREPLD